jgi:hypothetical protein
MGEGFSVRAGAKVTVVTELSVPLQLNLQVTFIEHYF